MAVRSPAQVRALHHGAVPVADLGRSYRFYSQLMGVRLERLLNATPQALQRGLVEIALLEFQGGLRFGLALQYDPIPPSPGAAQGTVWGLRAAPARVDEVTTAVQRRGVPTVAPPPLPAEPVLDVAVTFHDPDGNAWMLCRGGDGDAQALSFVSIEVTDLAAAESFYCNVVGLTCQSRSQDCLAFGVGSSGQWLFARRVDRMSPRVDLMQGPHIALEVDIGAFDSASSTLPHREKYWERETAKLPWQEPWARVVYFYDPFYNRLALIVA